MPPFTAFADLRAVCLDLPAGHPPPAAAVALREDTLTKPPKSLGRLEELTAFLAHWQGHAPPRLERTEVLVFAGNHGVTPRASLPTRPRSPCRWSRIFPPAAPPSTSSRAPRAPRCASFRLSSTGRPPISRSPALGEADFLAAVADRL